MDISQIIQEYKQAEQKKRASILKSLSQNKKQDILFSYQFNISHNKTNDEILSYNRRNKDKKFIEPHYLEDVQNIVDIHEQIQKKHDYNFIGDDIADLVMALPETEQKKDLLKRTVNISKKYRQYGGYYESFFHILKENKQPYAEILDLFNSSKKENDDALKVLSFFKSSIDSKILAPVFLPIYQEFLEQNKHLLKSQPISKLWMTHKKEEYDKNLQIIGFSFEQKLEIFLPTEKSTTGLWREATDVVYHDIVSDIQKNPELKEQLLSFVKNQISGRIFSQEKTIRLFDILNKLENKEMPSELIFGLYNENSYTYKNHIQLDKCLYHPFFCEHILSNGHDKHLFSYFLSTEKILRKNFFDFLETIHKNNEFKIEDFYSEIGTKCAYECYNEEDNSFFTSERQKIIKKIEEHFPKIDEFIAYDRKKALFIVNGHILNEDDNKDYHILKKEIPNQIYKVVHQYKSRLFALENYKDVFLNTIVNIIEKEFKTNSFQNEPLNIVEYYNKFNDKQKEKLFSMIIPKMSEKYLTSNQLGYIGEILQSHQANSPPGTNYIDPFIDVDFDKIIENYSQMKTAKNINKYTSNYFKTAAKKNPGNTSLTKEIIMKHYVNDYSGIIVKMLKTEHYPKKSKNAAWLLNSEMIASDGNNIFPSIKKEFIKTQLEKIIVASMVTKKAKKLKIKTL